jgi:WD40 repeat protein
VPRQKNVPASNSHPVVLSLQNVATTTMSSPPIDLALGEDGEDHPRRLLLMGNQLVAYGGDHGTLSVLVGDKAQVVRSFDDAIRAVAVSHDGKRVAIGFDDGSTKIYRYENSVSPEEQHPFLQKPDSTNEDDFLSQSDGLVENKDEKMFPGPRFDSPVRHLAFDPRSYHLCISSEAGVCIVDVTCPKSLQERYLQDMADREHDASGIRGVCYFHHKGKIMLATLAMDGRLCVWDVTGDDPSIDYELEHRDASKCVPKPDVGEIHNADICDRSCLPLAVGDSCLVLPGIPDVQLRLFHNLGKQEFLTSLPDRGHVDAIVAMAASPDGRHLVTSGRDGRVIIWSVGAKVRLVYFWWDFVACLHCTDFITFSLMDT